MNSKVQAGNMSFAAIALRSCSTREVAPDCEDPRLGLKLRMWVSILKRGIASGSFAFLVCLDNYCSGCGTYTNGNQNFISRAPQGRGRVAVMVRDT